MPRVSAQRIKDGRPGAQGRRALSAPIPSTQTRSAQTRSSQTEHTKKSSSGGAALVVGDTGIEPVTSSVSGKRATAAPIARNRKDPEWSCNEESGRRDSNSRHPPWQGGALPAELRPHLVHAGWAGGTASSKLPCSGGRYWDRTSDLFRVREARYRCANRPLHPIETGNQGFHRGGYGIRTRVYGFAGRCLASRPTHRVSQVPGNLCHDSVLRADDEIRTRDIHLGKVVLYQLSYVRISELRFLAVFGSSSRSNE